MKKTFYITSPFDKTVSEVLVKKGKYSNGRTALELIDTEDGIPYATASVNLSDVLLEENEIFIKDYAENEGILNFLVQNNIVKRTEKGVQSGFVWIPVCILNPESEWGNPEQSSDVKTEEERDGKKMFLIDGYRIWAKTYEEALELLSLIESL